MPMTGEKHQDRMKKGLPDPRGASWDGQGVNFAVFSAHAEKIELCLYDDIGNTEIARITRTDNTGEVFHTFILGL